MICFALPCGSVKKNMTHVALRGRGTTSRPITVFQLQVCSSILKFFASVETGSTETTRLQPGSSVFGDTHANGGGGGGGGDLATSMATWLSSSLRNESGKLKIFVVRTTLLAKSHRC